MGKNDGWIKIHRKMLDWEWFTDTNTAHFFHFCILNANTEDVNWKGIIIERGAFVSTLANMCKRTGLTIQQTRTAISHLKSTHEITCEATNEYTKITVCNYEKYQINIKENNTATNKRSNRQSTNEQHSEQQTSNTDIRSIEDIEDKKNIYSSTDVEEGEIEISRPEKKKKYSKEESELHSDCRKIFEETFEKLNNEKYYWTAKDAGALVGVLKQIRFFMSNGGQDDIAIDNATLKDNFRIFLEVICKRADAFTLKKFSLPYINGNFNEIYNSIKDNNGKQPAHNCTAGGFGYSADELADVFANLHAE